MATRKVPASQAPESERIQTELPFQLWYVPRFPLDMLGGKLDKDPEQAPWIMGLLEDIRQEGRLRNPVIVWNHHPLRGTKQPYWLLRAGSNRVWCAEQLGWKTVPAVVSTHSSEKHHPMLVVYGGRAIAPSELQGLFPDGGKLWANDHGFGLLAAPKPERTYAAHEPTKEELDALRPTGYGRDRIVNPLK